MGCLGLILKSSKRVKRDSRGTLRVTSSGRCHAHRDHLRFVRTIFFFFLANGNKTCGEGELPLVCVKAQCGLDATPVRTVTTEAANSCPKAACGSAITCLLVCLNCQVQACTALKREALDCLPAFKHQTHFHKTPDSSFLSDKRLQGADFLPDDKCL